MIRRPPTSMELKIDDLPEYENYCREETTAKIAKLQSKIGVNKSSHETVVFPGGAKTKQEIQERIGYVPKN